MINGREELSIPLFRNLKDDRYIFYSGKKVSSTKFDLEAVLKEKPTYKVLLLVDQKDSMELLSRRIAETMERFAVFSGLHKLSAKNLFIKNGKGLIPAPLEGTVNDHIKSGDIILFDLNYEEIWIEVDMTLYCVGKEYKFLFSLKVNLGEKLINFKQNIISLSVGLWNSLIKEENNLFNVYYLLKKFEFEGSKKLESVNELERTYNYVKEKYNFESKIKCNVEFININDHLINIFNQKKKELEVTTKDLKRQRILQNIKKLININNTDIIKSKAEEQISENLYRIISKTKNSLDNVVWKCDDTYEEELKTDQFKYSNEFSRCDSISEDFDSKFYPRTPPLLTFNKIVSHDSRKDDKYVSASPLKLNISQAREDIIVLEKAHTKTTNLYQDKKYYNLVSEIIKNFSLNDFVNENAEISLKFVKNENEFKVINFKKDLNENNFSRSVSLAETECVSMDKNKLKRMSIKKLRCVETLAKKKTYLFLVIVLVVILLYFIS